MIHSLLKSLLLYSTLAASLSVCILAAPAQQHHHPVGRSAEPLVARGISRREDLPLSHPRVAGFAGKRSKGAKKDAIVEKRITNAMRFANGLPPLAPRKLYNGSKSGSAHRARASPSFGSAILVYDSNGFSGSRLGYVSKGFNAQGDYAVTTDCTAAMLSPQLLSGALTNPASPSGYSNVGFLGLSSTTTLSTSSSAYASMGGTASTSTGSPPVKSGQHSDDPGFPFGGIESNVWSLGANNELIPTWVNPDGKQAHTEIGRNPDWANSIIISGSISTFRAAFSKGTVQIRLFITDQFTCGN